MLGSERKTGGTHGRQNFDVIFDPQLLNVRPEQTGAMDKRFGHNRQVASAHYERHAHQQTEEQAVRLNVKQSAGHCTRNLGQHELRVAELLVHVSIENMVIATDLMNLYYSQARDAMTGQRVVSEEEAAKILALPDDSNVPKGKVR